MNKMMVFLTCFLLLGTFSSFAFDLEIKNKEFANDPVFVEYLNEVKALVPQSMKDVIGKKLYIEFKDLSKKKNIKGLVKRKFLKSRKKLNKISLDNSVLKMIQNPNLANESAHKNNKRYSQAILLHEIMHVFDFRDQNLGEDQKFLEKCKKDRKNKGRKFRKACRKHKRKRYTLSDSILFTNLAGWNRVGLIGKKRKQHNHNVKRSADRYELTNEQEFLGVNFEFFILDPEYKCRRPNLYRFYSQALDVNPHADFECKQSTKILMTQEVLKGKEAEFVDIDPKRVYQIHYLFAGKGKAIMSKWGHAMVRLVVCAPYRKAASEECLKDTAYHIVLSFRANITGTAMNYIKGLNGSYDSMMFILALKDVVKEYTQGEFRDVFSVPLKITEKQKEELIDTVLNQYWGYRGSYYFITNNCANETLKLIRLGFKNDLQAQYMTVLTPSKLFKDMGLLELGDMSVLEDEKKAVKKGFLFKAAHKKLEKAHQSLSESGVEFSYEKYEDFLKDSSAQERRELTKTIGKEDRVKLLASMLKIENFIFERMQILLVKKLADYVNSQKKEGKLEKELEDYFKNYEEIQRQLLPENLLKEGYGIPLAGEFKALPENVLASQKKMVELGKFIIEWVNGQQKEELEEIQASVKNKRYILEELQKIL